MRIREPRGLILKSIDAKKRLFRRLGVFEADTNISSRCEFWGSHTAWEKVCALPRNYFTLYERFGLSPTVHRSLSKQHQAPRDHESG